MKIAQVAPLYEAVPPLLYGGTERVVAYLTDALVELGHEVTLFASGESLTQATLCPGRAQAIRLDPNPLKSDLAAHMTMLAEVRSRAHEFDLIHFHTDMIQFPMFQDIAHRTLTTLHGRLDLEDLTQVYRQWPMYPMVSISDDQRRGLPHANWAGTVQHGLPSQLLEYSPRGSGYLAFLGRISPEKRPDRAIAIAKAAGMPLKIAAKVDNADKQYFAEVIEPLIAGDPSIEFIGEINEVQKSAFLGGAEALLFPIDWPEPFGLVMIEAMACGTPVVAWRNGSTTEVIEPGETGWLVESLDDAVAAVRKALALDRAAIRARFELRFSAVAMARRYVTLYGDRLASLPFGETTSSPPSLNTSADLNLARIA
ncbi:glycosyltransferase [Caulobacter sp. SLTY]|uniref:glycosyltransferase n=1 Tax=Caulobacter sp. SLTY TaxID=2683262 RepID=UPI0014121022|nr:glycosyltransferase [Caulobacter sp. SLTY]